MIGSLSQVPHNYTRRYFDRWGHDVEVPTGTGECGKKQRRKRQRKGKTTGSVIGRPPRSGFIFPPSGTMWFPIRPSARLGPTGPGVTVTPSCLGLRAPSASTWFCTPYAGVSPAGDGVPENNNIQSNKVDNAFWDVTVRNSSRRKSLATQSDALLVSSKTKS